MPPGAAAASARNRAHHRSNSRQPKRYDSEYSNSNSSGGFLVTRTMPKPQRSKRTLGKNTQKSFRQKMADNMEQWKSVPALNKVSSCSESSEPRDRSRKSSVLIVEPPRPTLQKQRSKSSVLVVEPPRPKLQKEKSKRLSLIKEKTIKRLLSRGSSARTEDTFRSLETVADRLNPQMAPPLSASFPPSSLPQKFLIRRPKNKGEFTTIENQKGKIVAVVEETHYGRRLLKNSEGKVCAMILLHDQKYSHTKFSICGSEPVVHKQSIKYDQVGKGYYKWAQVKNEGGFGGTISLKHTKDETKSKDFTYCTKMFGSVFRLKQKRGHLVQDAVKNECAKLIPLGSTGRAVQIGPLMDTGLMLCYSVIIDEILENRMR